jgi:hypothetical protein
MRIERVVEVEDPVCDVLEIGFIRRAVDLGHGGLMARLLPQGNRQERIDARFSADGAGTEC